MTLPPLYPILDTRSFPGGPERGAFLAALITELAEAGVTLLQYRAKTDDRARTDDRAKANTREQILRDAEAIARAAPPGLTLILNDHAALLRETGFHGLHLGQGDLPIAEARAAFPDAILGLSTHTEAQAAAPNEADYLAAGPVFATGSKADAEPVIGLAGLAAARQATAKPLVAIGGITLVNALQVREAGADSVAILSALFATQTASGQRPGAVARDFLRLFRYNMQ